MDRKLLQYFTLMSSSPTLVLAPRRTASLYVMVVATLLFNLVDGLLTLLHVHTGLATEANPLLADLATFAPVRFMLVKVALVSLGAWFLWEKRDHRMAVVGICATFLGYAALVAYHLGMV